MVIVIIITLKEQEISKFKVGDKVRVLSGWETEEATPGWVEGIRETIGSTGFVSSITPKGWYRVVFTAPIDDYWFYPEFALEPVVDKSQFKIGDTVRVLRKFGSGEYGAVVWNKDMDSTVGEEGEIVKILSRDHCQFRVKFDNGHTWYYHDCVLELAHSEPAKPYFHNVKVGDKVMCLLNGEGVVTEVTNEDYSIEVRFSDDCDWYTEDGRLWADKNQCLFYAGTKVTIEPAAEPERVYEPRVGDILTDNSYTCCVTRISSNSSASVVWRDGSNGGRSVDYLRTQLTLVTDRYQTWQEAVNSPEFKGE